MLGRKGSAGDESDVLFIPAFQGNPYLRLLAGALAERGWVVRMTSRRIIGAWWRMPRIIHLHWERRWIMSRSLPIAVLRGTYLIVFLAAMRLSGRRVVWTVHNLADHQGHHPRMERLFQLLIARIAHVLVVHYPEAVGRASAWCRVSSRSIVVMAHPSYGGAHGERVDKAVTRANLGIPSDATVFIALGAIRRNKRLPELIRSFRGVPSGNVRLIVAGSPQSDADRRAVIAAAEGDDRIITELRYLDDEEVGALLSAADVFVHAADDQLTSGSIVLGMDFGLAVVAADRPHVRSLCGGEGGVVFDPSRPHALRRALEAAMAADLAAMGRHNRAVVNQVSWDGAAAVLAEAYTAGRLPRG